MKDLKYIITRKDKSQEVSKGAIFYEGEKVNIKRLDEKEEVDFRLITGAQEALDKVKEIHIGEIEKITMRDLNKFRNLEVLNLSGNITEIEGLEGLSKLRELRIDINEIREIKGLESLKNLEVLDLAQNKIREIKNLDALTNLTELNLIRNRIYKISGLENLRNLESLYISSNRIRCIEGLDNLEKLEILELRGNNITELRGLGNLKSLHTLSLENSGLFQNFTSDSFLGGFDGNGWARDPQRFVEFCRKKHNLSS